MSWIPSVKLSVLRAIAGIGGTRSGWTVARPAGGVATPMTNTIATGKLLSRSLPVDRSTPIYDPLPVGIDGLERYGALLSILTPFSRLGA